MQFWNLQSILIYLVILSFLVIVLFLFRTKIKPRFVSMFTLIQSIMVICYNLISFPFFLQENDWKMQPLPSNELIDLYENSLSPTRTSWIYPLIEDHYRGRTLLIPKSFVDSLDLSLERLVSQAQLADVKLIDFVLTLMEKDLNAIKDLDSAFFLNEKTNQSFYFVLEEKDPAAPLLLLRHENQIFFIPEDLLPGGEEDQ